MKGDHMGTGPTNPSPPELSLSNQTRFSLGGPSLSLMGRQVPEEFSEASSGLPCLIPVGSRSPCSFSQPMVAVGGPGWLRSGPVHDPTRRASELTLADHPTVL